jgi:RIO kinase 1
LENPLSVTLLEIPALDTFVRDGLITEILYPVKSGKEATVYCCRAGPSTGATLLAAKIYRPRTGRNFRNDAIYQEGRVILDKRLRRAYAAKTDKGRWAREALWVFHEFETLKVLHAAGADVPRPYAGGEGAILMEYIGERDAPAPPLNRVSLPREEAAPLFERLLRNVELWLSCDRVHADLSAFNILYDEGEIKVIDFPQAVDPRFNRNARALLERDLANICRYWERYGVRADPRAITADLWHRFQRSEL